MWITPSFTVDPATHLQNGEATEYVLKGTMQGGSLQQWGCAHGGEILDSESWTVDGVATTLTNGQWASGDEIVYSGTAHVDGATRFVDVTKTLTLNTTSMWLEGNYQFDWLENWTPHAENYVLMAEMDATDITTFTIIPGGTDYALSGSDVSGLRTHAMAGWSNSHEAIICYRTDPDAGMRFDVAGANFNTTLNKFYFSRTVEIGAAPEDTSWQWTNRFLALDGCGNHFLKTT